jgi:hypothetical protein
MFSLRSRQRLIARSTLERADQSRARVSLADLPAPSRRIRWSPRRKRLVLDAVEAGMLPLDDALARYEISLDEFGAWRAAFRREADPRPATGTRPRPRLEGGGGAWPAASVAGSVPGCVVLPADQSGAAYRSELQAVARALREVGCADAAQSLMRAAARHDGSDALPGQNMAEDDEPRP